MRKKWLREEQTAQTNEKGRRSKYEKTQRNIKDFRKAGGKKKGIYWQGKVTFKQ